MKFVFLLLLTAVCNFSYAQMSALFSAHPDAENLKSSISSDVTDAVILKLNQTTLQSISDGRSNLSFSLPINNALVTAELSSFEILKPNAVVISKTANGEIPINTNGLVYSYTGKLTGIENSYVSFTIYNEEAMGIVITGRDTYVLGKLGNETDKTSNYVLYREADRLKGNDMKCGSENMEVPEEIVRRMQEYREGDALGSDIRIAEIAIDIDYFTYNVYSGNVTNVTAWALALMSTVSAVYVKDMNIRLTIPYLRVWQVQDPYTSNDGVTLLNQFQQEWVNNQGSVQRTVAHLLSRRNNLNVAGIAYVNVLCNPSFGYGLSATLNGQINLLPAYSYDVVVIAHEIGHNFGSPHTHNCSWAGGPLDTCEQVEGGCYNGPIIPTAGSIMSYCDVNGGSVYMDFDPQPEALIRSSAENAGCMTNSSQSIYVAQPNGGELFRTGNTYNIFWGSSLSGNVNIEFSSNNGSSWNTIQNNVPAQNRQLSWLVPTIASSINSKIRILSSSNPAEGDTTNANFKIILSFNNFNPISPPNVTVLQVSSNDPTLQNFVWQRAGTHPSITYKWKIRKGGTANEISFDANNSGFDTTASIRKSMLDSLAAAFGTTGDSVLCSWRAWAYNGYDSTSSNSFVIFLKRTTVGIEQISSEIPKEFALKNNYPNPFNPETNIEFDVPVSGDVMLEVFDISGKKVAELVKKELQPGTYKYSWNASAFSSGAYFYRLSGKGFKSTKRMILMK